MTHPAADRIIGLYQDKAADWIRDRGAALRQHEGDWDEVAWLDRFTQAGYVDTFRQVHGDKAGEYSWWSYRFKARERNVGWRIDYFFVSEELKGKVKNAWIEQDAGGSDHCPVGLELDI